MLGVARYGPFGIISLMVSDGKRSMPSGPIIISIFLITFALGLGRFWLTLDQSYLELAPQIDQVVTLRGVVMEEPDRRDTSTRLVVQVADKNFKILATVPAYPAYHYGDDLELSGKLLRPENFDSFDYINYLAKDDIHYQLFQPKIKLLGREQGHWLKAKLLAVKNAFLNKINLILPEPESSLLAGLTVGAKQSLGTDWLERFRVAGVSHIVVLSGYNVTIIAESLSRIFRFLPLIPGRSPLLLPVGLGALSIILFAIMTGGGATIIRASIMALIALLGRVTGRIYDVTVALLLAALIMILIKPQILVSDISFQLSFLATLGLIYLSPPVLRWLWWCPEKFGLRAMAASTIAAQLTVLPWILYKMGLLSLVALPVNLLILLTIPATMALGFFSGFLAFVATWLAWPVALLAHGLLSYQLLVVKFFANIPGTAVTIPSFPWWAVVISYLIIIYWIMRAHNPTPTPLPEGEGATAG